MINKIAFIAVSLILFGCSQNGSEKEVLMNDSLIEADINGIHDDSSMSAAVEFIPFNKKGLMLPGKFKIFNDNLTVKGEFSVDKIKEVIIAEISINKHPQTEGEQYCDWSNFLKIIYQNDTLMVFGSNVLEINSEEKDLKAGKEIISVLVASNFTMECADEEGLTGCDDFSYLIVKSGNNEYSLIFTGTPDDKNSPETAILAHDEGMSESIENTACSGDTVKLFIKVGYQDGEGSYTLNIFKQNKWMYLESDRKIESGI
jgi:hypothetical protein